MNTHADILRHLRHCEDRLSTWAETEILYANRDRNHQRSADRHARATNYRLLAKRLRLSITALENEHLP